jgi:hypothetical protein
MSAKNIYHDTVIAALVADGWTITDDPLGVVIGTRRLFVDIGADRTAIGAERKGKRIAVEVQSFLSKSDIEDFHRAVGQYVVYRFVIEDLDPDRALYLAVPDEVYTGILSEPLGRLVATGLAMKVIVFDQQTQRIVKWIS